MEYVNEYKQKRYGMPRNSLSLSEWTGVPDEFRIEHLPNRSLEQYHYAKQFGPAIPHVKEHNERPTSFIHREAWPTLVFGSILGPDSG
jgi:hypothetical protein